MGVIGGPVFGATLALGQGEQDMIAAQVRVDEQAIAAYIVTSPPHGKLSPHSLPG